jgi:hypothetical protein
MISRKLVVFIFIITIPFFIPQIAHAAWTDDFTNQNNRWEWDYVKNAGYHQITTIEGINIAELGVTKNATSTQYSDSSLHEKQSNYTQGILEMKIKLTDDNGVSDLGKGSRGWGFWDGNDNYSQTNCAWFISLSPQSANVFSGFRMQIVIDGNINYNQIITDVDMREWHIYRVEIGNFGTKFYVDNILKGSSISRPNNNLKAEIWLDNYRVYLNGQTPFFDYLKFDQDEKLYLDWVKYWDNLIPSSTPVSSPNPTPSGSPIKIENLKILLSQYLSTSDNIYYPIDNKVNILDAGYILGKIK